jgi:hypothetical protein
MHGRVRASGRFHAGEFPPRARRISTIPRNAFAGWLVVGIAVLALAASLTGLFWQGGEGVRTITTYRGQTEEIYGRGLYRDSSLFTGDGAKGTDAITLLLALPLLAGGTMLWRRGSVRGGLVLLGALTWFLYVYGSLALGSAAYNDLFLVCRALRGKPVGTHPAARRG